MDDPVNDLIVAILKLRRIRGKMVILCEGERTASDLRTPRSPQMYARQGQMPDASFYAGCIPRAWQNHRIPIFFNCGGRADVLRTFTGLLAAHHRAPEDSHLCPDKLYALIDLDVQVAQLPEFPQRPSGIATTEDLHAALYHRGKLRDDIAEQHRIFVTSLVHKEAFYLLPVVTPAVVDGVHGPPIFRGQPLRYLSLLHDAVADRLHHDGDLTRHIATVQGRLMRCSAGAALRCDDGASLTAAWQAAVEDRDREYTDLVETLLAVAKAKPVWQELCPPTYDGPPFPAATYREQLAFAIARRIAELTPSEHPLAALFAYLEPRR